MKSCLKQIHHEYDRLSPSEKIFADMVIKRPQAVVEMPIAKIAEALGIAPSTIIGAAKKLGFDGLRTFKLSLASEVINPIEQRKQNQEEDVPENGQEDILHHVVRTNCEALEECGESLSQGAFTSAARVLMDAGQIYVMGIGTSGILARELHDYLFRLRLPITCVEDQHYQLLVAERAKKTDCVIAISQSGVNKNIIEVCERIRANGCRIIGLSNFMETPFAKYTDLYLAPFHSFSTLHDNNFSFRIPMLCMIETLYYTLASLMEESYQTAMEEHQALVAKTALTGEK